MVITENGNNKLMKVHKLMKDYHLIHWNIPSQSTVPPRITIYAYD